MCGTVSDAFLKREAFDLETCKSKRELCSHQENDVGGPSRSVVQMGGKLVIQISIFLGLEKIETLMYRCLSRHRLLDDYF